MLKARGKLISLLTACMALVLMLVMGIVTLSIQPKVASAANTEIVFNLGANGSAAHKDGSTKKTTYSETSSGYTLSLTSGTNMYPSSYDAKGNSCIKLGASSKTGGFTISNIPDDVTQVIISVAGYKDKTVKVTAAGSSTTVSTLSNNGAYTDIKVDVSSSNSIVFTTTSTGYRAMVNTITFVIPAQEGDCVHENETSEITKAATCTETGVETFTCECGETRTEEIPALGHEPILHAAQEPTCTESGWDAYETCANCDYTTKKEKEIAATGHNVESASVSNGDGTHQQTGTCSDCGESTSVTEDCVYGEGVDGENDVVYTCTLCEYELSVAKYTVSFVVPNSIDAIDSVKVEEGKTTTLPSANAEEGYTFVGWATETIEKTETVPEFVKAGDAYTVTESITLYALYSYTEGSSAYTLLKDDSKLAVDGEIVIVSSDGSYALGTNQASNNRTAVAVTTSNEVVTWTTAVQVITLKAGSTAGTWAFHVTGGTGTNATNGYLYAPASGNYLRTQTSITDNSSWNISITSAGVATIKANVASGQNWLRKNSQSALFSCYTSGQNDVSIYMKSVSKYYVTAFNSCEHANQEEVIKAATCLEAGLRTVTCLDCESEIETEIIPALGHSFVDGVCENCSNLDPATIVYNGYYYLSINGKYAGEKDGSYYKLFDGEPATVDVNYVFYFVKNGELYDMYNVKAGLIEDGVTIETQEDYTVCIKNGDGKILSYNTSYTTYQRMGFYAASNSYPNNIKLTAVEIVSINSASVTLGEDVALNYYVTMADGLENVMMNFTMNGEVYDRTLTQQTDGRYKVSLELPPQYMANVIKVDLIVNEEVVETMDYSVKMYAQNKLSAADSSNELKRLVSDMLYYGAAAQMYKGYNTENLVTDGVTGILAEQTEFVPTETNFALENNEEIDVYGAYFKSAGVRFADVNKIYVKLIAEDMDKVALTINGVAVAVSETVYTSGIVATDFAEKYTFVLSYDGVVMQTLTYSVNAYAYAKQGKDAMGQLALALYRYGASASAYNA